MRACRGLVDRFAVHQFGEMRSISFSMRWKVLILMAIGLSAVGCASARPVPLTPGMAKKHLHPGTTNQAEVVEMFGPPNIITQQSEGEMWVYDKTHSEYRGGALGGAGLGGGSGSGGLFGGGLFSTRRSETTAMLIIYYDERDLVRDYKFSQTKF